MKRICLRKSLMVADFDRDGVEGVALGWWRIFIFWNTDWGNVRNLYNLCGKISKKYISLIVILDLLNIECNVFCCLKAKGLVID